MKLHYKWNMLGTALGLSQRNLHDIKERGSHSSLSLCSKKPPESWVNIKVEHTWDHVCSPGQW